MEYTIYAITCKDVEVSGIYVGSTKSFHTRQLKHKYDSKNETKTHIKLYKCIKENGGISNWEYKILESSTCEKQTEAFIRERYYIDELKADLNTNMPYTTIEEKRISQVEFNVNNKEKLSARQKHYFLEHREKRLEQFKQYYISNKEKIASQHSEKIYCESCDCYHNKYNKAIHYRSKKHIDNLVIFTDK
jgi:hypothetical protein